MLLRIGQHAVSQRFGVRGAQRRHFQRTQVAMYAHPWSAVGRDVQVAAAHLDHLLQQFAQRNSRHLCTLFGSELPSPNFENRSSTKPFRAVPLPWWSSPTPSSSVRFAAGSAFPVPLLSFSTPARTRQPGSFRPTRL